MRNSNCCWCEKDIVVPEYGVDFCNSICQQKYWIYIYCINIEMERKGRVDIFTKFYDDEGSDKRIVRRNGDGLTIPTLIQVT